MFGAEVAASANQSDAPPNPFVKFAVMLVPPATLVALTAIAAVDMTTEKGSDPEVPPPGGGEKTVTAAVPALATSLAGIAARS